MILKLIKNLQRRVAVRYIKNNLEEIISTYFEKKLSKEILSDFIENPYVYFKLNELTKDKERIALLLCDYFNRNNMHCTNCIHWKRYHPKSLQSCESCYQHSNWCLDSCSANALAVGILYYLNDHIRSIDFAKID